MPARRRSDKLFPMRFIPGFIALLLLSSARADVGSILLGSGMLGAVTTDFDSAQSRHAVKIRIRYELIPLTRMPVLIRHPGIAGRRDPTLEEINDSLSLSGWTEFCSGTLIRSDVVLSAAHCFDPYVMRRVGGTSFLAPRRVNSIEIRGRTGDWIAGRYRNHPDYDRASPRLIHDISLLRLNRRAPQQVQLALLPDSDSPSPESLIAAGFGRSETEDFGELRTARLPYRGNMNGESSFWAGDGNYYAGGAADEPKGVCTGDSGGPAFYPDQNSEGVLLSAPATLLGVVSHMTNDCQSSFSAFTDVRAHLPWIQETMASWPERPEPVDWWRVLTGG